MKTCKHCGAEFVAPTSQIDICVSCYIKKHALRPKEELRKEYYDELVE